MSGLNGNGSVPSLPPPQPKSPPQLYGRRRELAKVQILEREIGVLEEELKCMEGLQLQLASRSCKEVADFVTGNPDPLIPTTKKIRRSCRCFWKWLWCSGIRVSCLKVSWIWCCSWPCGLKLPRWCCCCCDCITRVGNPCADKCPCLPSCWNNSQYCCCFKIISKCNIINCCCFSIPKCRASCPTCSCTRRCTCCPECRFKLKNICSSCHKTCCCYSYPCYFCY